MSELVVRPSMKLVRVSYGLILVLIVAVGMARWRLEAIQAWPWWLVLLPALLLVLPAKRHLLSRFTKMMLVDGKLRYETGVLSRSSRNMDVAKVQDVRVDQTLGQRFLGTGNVSVETAGEVSRLTLHNVDDPEQVAERILAASRRAVQPEKRT